MIEFTATKLANPSQSIEDYVGFIPMMLSETDPRPAKEQFDENYAHGGGWRPFEGFKYDAENHKIKYPGDPPFYPYASAKLRDETIFVYPYSWVLILQPDGSHEIARMD